MSQNLTVSILLARGGSKGVPGKNLKTVGGLSLVARSVLASLQSDEVAEAYVSTDSEEIATEARKFGARVIMRPSELAGDDASSESGWLHALIEIKKEHPDVSRLVLLQCTSPFTTGGDIDGCLSAMEEMNAACALSVIEDHVFLWSFGSDGLGRGVNHDETTQRLRRQDLRQNFIESGAIYTVRVADFERVGRRFCGPVALYPLSHPGVEIDTPDDLRLCNLAATTVGSQHPSNLADVKALVMDFDGVHTNDLAIVDQHGIEAVIVSRRDGLGLERLRRSGGIHMLILSKERNEVVARRADKLQVECLQAKDDKVEALSSWLAQKKLMWEDVLYVGNDLNDLDPLRRAGFSAAPCDADPHVLSVVKWIIPVRGGEGVLREISDALLSLKERPPHTV